jgi:anti-anti-sigma factor
MDIHVKKEAKGLIVSIIGRLDAVSVGEFDKEMDEQIKKGESNFILDLSRLDYISSAGLRSILSTSKRLKENKGTITLCGLHGGVKEVFDISGFSSIFTIYESLENALKSVN